MTKEGDPVTTIKDNMPYRSRFGDRFQVKKSLENRLSDRFSILKSIPLLSLIRSMLTYDQVQYSIRELTLGRDYEKAKPEEIQELIQLTGNIHEWISTNSRLLPYRPYFTKAQKESFKPVIEEGLIVYDAELLPVEPEKDGDRHYIWSANNWPQDLVKRVGESVVGYESFYLGSHFGVHSKENDGRSLRFAVHPDNSYKVEIKFHEVEEGKLNTYKPPTLPLTEMPEMEYCLVSQRLKYIYDSRDSLINVNPRPTEIPCFESLKKRVQSYLIDPQSGNPYPEVNKYFDAKRYHEGTGEIIYNPVDALTLLKIITTRMKEQRSFDRDIKYGNLGTVVYGFPYYYPLHLNILGWFVYGQIENMRNQDLQKRREVASTLINQIKQFDVFGYDVEKLTDTVNQKLLPENKTNK